MRGSILVTFDELINDRGIDQFSVVVNSVQRDFHFTDVNNYYSTYCFVGDVVRFVCSSSGARPIVNITRKDFTTDDEGGDKGIKETSISPTIIQSGATAVVVEFTATTRSDAYNFHYIFDVQTVTPTPTPTPTLTPTQTPTLTPTITPTITPTPLAMMNWVYEWSGITANEVRLITLTQRFGILGETGEFPWVDVSPYPENTFTGPILTSNNGTLSGMTAINDSRIFNTIESGIDSPFTVGFKPENPSVGYSFISYEWYVKINGVTKLSRTQTLSPTISIQYPDWTNYTQEDLSSPNFTINPGDTIDFYVKQNFSSFIVTPTPTITPTFTLTPTFTPTVTPTVTPTPTITPTVTLTPTFTPTPTTAPITWNLTYKMSSSGTPTGTKEVNNMYFLFNGITYTRPNFTWVGSANTNYNFAQDTNSAFDQIFVGRELCRRSGASSLTLDSYQLRIIVNSVQVYNVTTNITNRSIPLCPTIDDVYVGTTTGLTINSGDVVTVEYTDIFT